MQVGDANIKDNSKHCSEAHSRPLAKNAVAGMVDKSRRWHTPVMSKPDLNIDSLSPEERLQLIEELWDSLSESPAAMPLSDAQRGELDRRLDDLERSGPSGIPWEEVLQQIRTRPR